MYIFSFFKSLFRPRKILCSLYFLLNMAIIFLVFGYVAPFDLGADEVRNLVINGFIGVGINFAIMLIALSPIGEAYVRFKEKVVKVERNEDTKELYALFDEVYERAVEKDDGLSDKIKLYFSNTQEINACALGHRTVIVTAGLLENMDADRIKGVLAHEFGHISSGDSDLKLGISVSNCILLIFTVILNLIIGLFSIIFGMLSEDLGDIVSGAGIFIVTIAYSLWVKLGMLLVNATSRKDEYAADAFAVDCGYGEHLYIALDSLDGTKTKSDFLSLLASTHPDTVDRLAAIKSRLDKTSLIAE